jgi:integrase
MIIVSLNTGIRQGSLFRLRWSDIDFQEGILTVRAVNAKNEKTVHIPMNETLTCTLMKWKEQTAGDGEKLVFPSPKSGKIMDNCKSAWAKLLKDADISNFRWHDMRHDFASHLVMNGVDLNTVRELMGHSDLKMTLRYAHLAPAVKMKAVETLDK